MAPGITILQSTEITGIYDKDEIVSLMTQYYELLAKMRYFPKSDIKYPPHNPAIDLDLANELNLDSQVIELLQALPYVEGRSGEDEFICNGSFADMMDPEQLRQSRDPEFADPNPESGDYNGEYVRPWEVVLNNCGNHGSVMYLNLRNGHITMVGQDSGESSDPALREIYYPDRSDINRNSHEHLPSRHAKEFFEDFMNRIIKLEWIPSKTDRSIITEDNIDEYDDLKLLYRTYGWPNDFDAQNFDVAYMRLFDYWQVRNHAFESWRRLHLRNEKVDADGWKSEEDAILESWKRHLSRDIAHNQEDLDYMKGVGREHYNQEEILKQEEELTILQKRLQNVEDEPITVEHAIKRRED